MTIETVMGLRYCYLHWGLVFHLLNHMIKRKILIECWFIHWWHYQHQKVKQAHILYTYFFLFHNSRIVWINLCQRAWMFSVLLQTVPACQNLYKNSFTYYCLQGDQDIPFDDAMHFLGVHLNFYFMNCEPV